MRPVADRVAREVLIRAEPFHGREQEARIIGRRELIRIARDLPVDRLPHDAAAGVVIRRQQQLERLVNRNLIRAGNIDFEIRNAIGFFLERDRHRLFIGEFALDKGRVFARRHILFVKKMVKTPAFRDFDIVTPLFLAGALHDQHGRLGFRLHFQMAFLPITDVALDMHRLFGAIDRPFGKNMGFAVGLFFAAHRIFVHPAQPRRTGVIPVIVGELRRRDGRIQD